MRIYKLHNLETDRIEAVGVYEKMLQRARLYLAEVQIEDYNTGFVVYHKPRTTGPLRNTENKF